MIKRSATSKRWEGLFGALVALSVLLQEARQGRSPERQPVFSDAIIPGSKLLGFANCDHWALALAFNRDMPLIAATTINRSAFPREVLLESIARLVSEDLAADAALLDE